MLKDVVVIDNYSYPKGGTAQVAIQSSIELSKKTNVTYICIDKVPNPDLINNNIRVYNIATEGINTDNNRLRAAINGIWNSKVYSEVYNILKSYDAKSTVVHVHGYIHYLSVSIFKACKRLNLKTVLTLHDYFTVCPNGGLYNYRNNRICQLRPMSLKCILCNCDKRNYIQKIWRLIRQVFINRYVKNNKNLYLFYISNYSFSKMKEYLKNNHICYYVRNPYDIGDGEKYYAEKNFNYVYMGRLSFEKGVDIFCEAYTQLYNEGRIKSKAIVIGDGPQLSFLENKYKNIIFLGWKGHNELPSILKEARALVFPSKLYEGAPLTPIEFMSCGIPCISSDSCASIEYIEPGINGLIFKSEDVDDLKKQMLISENCKIWENISKKLRDDFNPDEFSVNNHVKKILKIYNELLREV